MKRFALLLTGLLLISCTKTATTELPANYRNSGDPEFPVQAAYELDFNMEDRREDLLEAVQRIVMRRLDFHQLQSGGMGIDTSATPPVLTVNLQTQSGADALTKDLTSNFTVRFMKQVESPEAALEQGGLVVAEVQGFVDTPLNDSYIDWVSEDKTDTNSKVTIQLTDAGQAVKKDVFAENMNGNIGLFIRNKPVYKILVDEDDLDTPNVVINIPNPELSTIFVDDINVSEHVTFTPQP